MMMKNKRGDVAIVLLVLLVVLVTFSTIFSFITNSKKVETKISDVRFIEGFYLKENLIKFYLKQAGEDAIVETYNYLESQEGWSDKEFETNIGINFKEEFAKYNFNESYLISLKEIIDKNSFIVSKKGEVLNLEVLDLEMKDSFGDIEVDYTPKIFLKFDLKN